MSSWSAIFKIATFTLLYSVAQCGYLQTAMDLVSRAYELPQMQISNELDTKFDQTVQILLNPKRKILVQEPSGKHRVQCSSEWVIYREGQTPQFKTEAKDFQVFLDLFRVNEDDQDEETINRKVRNSKNNLFVQQELGPNVDEVLILFDQIAAGARLATTVSNYQPCRDSVTPAVNNWWYYLNYQEQVKLGQQKQLGFWAYTDNITMTISNSADLVNKCTYSGQTTFASLATYFTKFTGFGNYILSFVMNLVSNTQNLINVMNSITAADTNCDLLKLYNDIGKIIRYVTKVDPVSASSFDDTSFLSKLDNKAIAQYADRIIQLNQKFSDMTSDLSSFLSNQEELQQLKFYTFEQLYEENFNQKHLTQKRLQKEEILRAKYGMIDRRQQIQKFNSIPTVQDTKFLTKAYQYTNMTYGFLNGTGLFGSANTTQCQANQIRYLQLLLDKIPLSLIGGKPWDLIYGLSELMAKLFPLQSTCRFGYDDQVKQVKKYLAGYQNWWDFLDTFSFNFGLFYDSIVTAFTSVTNLNYFMSGYSVGRTIYLLFFMA
ncbi:UNKNOWN [Stylonychia lemnae]|uniref:Uncharacterized protein n=1 Tax=Stylonychia lemnae TaxID=5949 RepID=A0A078AIG0_STYLE|nr:UNKNOWN [Stylonychia lemnae]|eukprot:CDW80598.1 UNKNOWN [Stylonychia lemnae]